MKIAKFIFFSLLTGLLGFGCGTYKNIPYFQDLSDSARADLLNFKYQPLLIKPDDVLSINIQTIDPTANIVFNQNPAATTISATPTMVAAATNTQGLNGFLVDKNGEVALPLVGKVKLSGLSTETARDTIQARVAKYYVQPTVNVRFINLKVTILGEVQRPGSYILVNEKNTIFDALGLAGDLTIYGKRENILLIRDSAGKSNLIRFSLNSKDIVQKDFFYLRQNDVLYVEPNKSRIESLDAIKTRNYTIAASILSVVLVVATRIR